MVGESHSLIRSLNFPQENVNPFLSVSHQGIALYSLTKIKINKWYLYFRQGHAQAMGQQQQASVPTGKELPPAHQASLPQSQVAARTNPVYQPPGYTSVTPQVSFNIIEKKTNAKKVV